MCSHATESETGRASHNFCASGLKRFTIRLANDLDQYHFYTYRHIFVVELPFLKGQHGRTGRKNLQSSVNNSLTLNLIVCRKTQRNLKRTSLPKRKAQHRRKRIRRKKHVKVKTQRARFILPGFFTPLCYFSWEYDMVMFCVPRTKARLSASFYLP